MSDWYQKRALSDEVVQALDICPRLFSMLSEKVHSDDLGAVALYLTTYTQILKEVLYKPCEAPGALLKEYN